MVWTWARERDGDWPTLHAVMEFTEMLHGRGMSAEVAVRRLREVAGVPTGLCSVRLGDETWLGDRHEIDPDNWLVRVTLPEVDIVVAAHSIYQPTLRRATMSDWKFTE